MIMLSKILQIERKKKSDKQKEIDLGVCPKCNKKMYGGIYGPRNGGFSCERCGYWIMF